MGSAEALLQLPGLIWTVLLLVSLLAFRRKAVGAGLLALAGAAWLWVVGATPLSGYLLATLEKPYDRVPGAIPPSADAVVMLGGAIGFSSREVLWFGTGEATDRALTALELMRQKRAPVLVLNGPLFRWKGRLQRDSELLAAWMRSWKLPTGELLLLPSAVDTHDEALNTLTQFRKRGWKRIILVSSAYHLWRASATFRKAGIEVIPFGCDFLGLPADEEVDSRWLILPRSERLKLFNYWLHEKIGWIWYWWKGWI